MTALLCIPTMMNLWVSPLMHILNSTVCCRCSGGWSFWQLVVVAYCFNLQFSDDITWQIFLHMLICCLDILLLLFLYLLMVIQKTETEISSLLWFIPPMLPIAKSGRNRRNQVSHMCNIWPSPASSQCTWAEDVIRIRVTSTQTNTSLWMLLVLQASA